MDSQVVRIMLYCKSLMLVRTADTFQFLYCDSWDPVLTACSYLTVHMPDGVSFVDAAGCVGDAVKAYIALHYMGRLGGPHDTGLFHFGI